MWTQGVRVQGLYQNPMTSVWSSSPPTSTSLAVHHGSSIMTLFQEPISSCTLAERKVPTVNADLGSSPRWDIKTALKQFKTCGSQGGGGWGEVDREFGISRGKLLHIRMDKQQGPCKPYGKEYEKRINIYVQLSHFSVQQKLTQHSKSIIFQ